MNTQAKSTRNPPDKQEFHGLWFLVSKKMHLKDGRVRSKVALCHPCKSGSIMDRRTVDARSLSQLDEKITQTIAQLANDYMDDIFQLIKTGEYRNAEFGLYRALRYETVCMKKHWAGQAQQHDDLWERFLKQKLGKMPLSDLRFFDCTKAVMDSIFDQSGHRAKSVEEQLCWIQLSDFFDAAVEDGIFPYNPAHSYAARYKHSMNADVLHKLSARSLSQEELLAFVKGCFAADDSSLRTCMLLHVLLGLNQYELCGLDIGAVRRLGNLNWLEIRQAYYQKRGQAPIMQEMLTSANQYRRIVCTAAVDTLLAVHLKQRKAEGASEKDPLFVENKARLRPESLKKAEDRLLDQVMAEGMHIAINARGRPHKEGRDRARTDILRGTAAYCFQHTAGMSLAQIALMLGIDRIHTYATHYVDWNNYEIMVYMKLQLEQWHNDILRVSAKQPKSYAADCQPDGGHTGIALRGRATPGALMTLRSPFGMNAYIGPLI